MSSRKTISIILVLLMVLSIPLMAFAEPRQEPVPAQTDDGYVNETLLGGFLTAVNIPSRLTLCGLNAGLSAIVMGASAGRESARAAQYMREGCVGPWVINLQAAPLEAREDELTREYQAALAQRERLRQESEQKEQEIARLKSTYDELVSSLKKEIEAGKVKISEYESLLTVNMVATILFDSGKAEIKPEGLDILKRVGDILKNATDKEIRIEGHTDNVPIAPALAATFPTNWELSTARATVMARYLREEVGIPPERLSATGFAKYRPVAPNTTPEGREQNRRIEIILAPSFLASVTE